MFLPVIHSRRGDTPHCVNSQFRKSSVQNIQHVLMACHSFRVKIISFCTARHIAHVLYRSSNVGIYHSHVSLPAVVLWGRSIVDITQTTITQWHPQKPNFFLLDCCRRHEYFSPNTFPAKTLLCGYVIHLTSEALSCIVSPDMCFSLRRLF
jgi:hypothetical protein